MRRLLRRTLPFAVRWRLRELVRRAGDARCGVRFATSGVDAPPRSFLVCEYALPLVCYPGQEAAFAAKRSNIELALHSIDGMLVQPGETLSFWKCVGPPTVRRGYGVAAALKDGELTSEVGGAICFVSTILYNAALLSGMTVVERYGHSVDSYGDARYFELGRDAAVEYAYRDFRARNDFEDDLQLRACLDDSMAVIEVRSTRDLHLCVELDVRSAKKRANGEFAVNTVRHLLVDGRARTDDLGITVYRHPPVQ
ncbi:MAG: VanW family protein [Dehalococcoidia bacterium]